MANRERSRDAKPTGPSPFQGRTAGLPDALLEGRGIGGARMRKIMVLIALLLPTVLLASVTETAIPSTFEAYLAAAGDAMEDGDFEAALLLYEEAVERDPHSQAALAGRLVAFSQSRDYGSAVNVAGMN